MQVPSLGRSSGSNMKDEMLRHSKLECALYSYRLLDIAAEVLSLAKCSLHSLNKS